MNRGINMIANGEIQDLLTDMSQDIYIHPAYDHEEFN